MHSRVKNNVLKSFKEICVLFALRIWVHFGTEPKNKYIPRWLLVSLIFFFMFEDTRERASPQGYRSWL